MNCDQDKQKVHAAANEFTCLLLNDNKSIVLLTGHVL